MLTSEKQSRKECRIHRNAMRNPNSRARRYLRGESIPDRPNWDKHRTKVELHQQISNLLGKNKGK